MEKTYRDILARSSGGKKDLGTIGLSEYRDKLRGAFLGRMSGCTLGAPVEGWTLDRIDAYADETGMTKPFSDYWTQIPNPDDKRYIVQTFKDYLRGNINGVPCDDDVGFTILTLLIAGEGRGRDFTVGDVAEAWKKYITEAYTAERVALDNLEKGVAPEKAAELDNPYDELIGADIRIDGYGYMSPCDPEKAAHMAFTDAYLSHRGEGIYGAMYFAAVIAAAFALGDAKKACEEGLKYIPADSELYSGVSWALGIWDKVGDFKNAAKLVDERYPGMNIVHTLNNACLTVFALALGGKDVGCVFANAVAMAHDADCTAATAGSIAGACYGIKALDSHWYAPFGDTVNSFYNGARTYSISALLAEYERYATKECGQTPSRIK